GDPGRARADRALACRTGGIEAAAPGERALARDPGLFKKSDCLLRASVRERYAMIQATPRTVPIAERCRVLQVARSGYYAWCRRPRSERTQADALLLQRIRTIHLESKARYGRVRIHRELRAQGIRCGQKRVGRLLRTAGLRAVYPRPYRVTTHGSVSAAAANCLAQRFDVAAHPRLNQTWTADLTYLWTGDGWLFLAVILDLASRRV